MVSAVPPQENNNGYEIRSAFPDHIQANMPFDAHAHVFLVSDGTYVTDATCFLHLYTKDGHHLYEGRDDVVSHDFDYAWDLSAGNFSQIGTHTYIIQCNGSVGVDNFGGFTSGEYYVSGFGEASSTGSSISFNSAMFFLLILFILAIVGLFIVDNYIGKFVLYWVAHVLFVVSTFNIWQYNEGYGLFFLGLAGVWKVMFYVSTIAVFPMIILSIAWIVYIHTFNEHFQKLIDNGGNSEDAFRMAKRKSGGWFSGK